jgi:hypothetical protein
VGARPLSWLSWRHVAPPSPLLLRPLVPSVSVACPDKTRCPKPEQPLAWPVGALYSSCLGLDAPPCPSAPHPAHPPLALTLPSPSNAADYEEDESGGGSSSYCDGSQDPSSYSLSLPPSPGPRQRSSSPIASGGGWVGG